MTVIFFEAIEGLADIGIDELLMILKNATGLRDRLDR